MTPRPTSSSMWAAQVRVRQGSLLLDVDLDIHHATTVVIGPNGSGKTTLVKALAGLLPADDARIVVDGDVWCDTSSGVDRPPSHRQVGYVPQGLALFSHLDVVDNVAFGLSTRQRRLAADERRQQAQQMLASLDIADLGALRPSALSGGQAQKVALARALLASPRLLLLDEPLAALDAIARRRTRAVVNDVLQHRHLPCVWVSHDVQDALALDAHVVALHDGRVVQQGSVQELKDAPADDFVAAFVDVDRVATAP